MNDISFGDLFTSIRNGLSIKQDKSGDGLPISRIETISNGIIDPSRVGYAGIQLKDGKDWLLQSGDLLFSHINSVEHIGKCAVYNGVPAQLVHGMNLLCLRPNKDRLDSNYAQWLIRSSGFRSRLSNFINKAVNQASVSTTNLRSIRVTVPPVKEQRRIAAILDQAEALRAKRRQAIAKLDTLTQSLFLEMFGDPRSNPMKWTVCTLGELIVDGPQNGIYKPTGCLPSKMAFRLTSIRWMMLSTISFLCLRRPSRFRCSFPAREFVTTIFPMKKRTSGTRWSGTKKAKFPTRSAPQRSINGCSIRTPSIRS